MSDQIAMTHTEWLRFKAWCWAVGGTEAARMRIGISAAVFEGVWLRWPLTTRTWNALKRAMGEEVRRDVA